MSWWKKSEEKSIGEELKREEQSLERCVNRLIEIQTEIGEIGKQFDEEANLLKKSISGGEEELLKACTELINKLRLPGFCANHLAQEGIILGNIIAAKAQSLKIKYDKAGIKSEAERLENVLKVLYETETPLRQTLEEMSPYQTLDPTAILESIVKRIKASRNR